MINQAKCYTLDLYSFYYILFFIFYFFEVLYGQRMLRLYSVLHPLRQIVFANLDYTNET